MSDLVNYKERVLTYAYKWAAVNGYNKVWNPNNGGVQYEQR